MNKILSNIQSELLYRAPRGLAHRIIYKKTHGKEMNYSDPQTYDELIHWFSANVYNENYGRYVDKIEVRDYVRECGLEKLLIPLEGKGVYDHVKDIDFSELPEKYIIKANHGSGPLYYHICRNGRTDISDIEKKFDHALKLNFAKHSCEYQYASVKPRLMIEKLLVDSEHDNMTDYKVVCSYGKAIAILVCYNRNEGRDYYSVDWKYLDYTKQKYRSNIILEKPETLDEMISAAEVLSRPFPLSRIDMYEVNGRLYFGEVTLTPSAGRHLNLTDYAQAELGKKIKTIYENTGN